MMNDEDAKLLNGGGWGGGIGGEMESESQRLLETRRTPSLGRLSQQQHHDMHQDYHSTTIQSNDHPLVPHDHHPHHRLHAYTYIPRTVTVVNRPHRHQCPFPEPTTTANPPDQQHQARIETDASLVSKLFHEIKTHWRCELFTSFVLLFILFMTSHTQPQEWTLIVGETRSTMQSSSLLSFWTHTPAAMITVSHQPTTATTTSNDHDDDDGLAALAPLRVYDIPGGTCPSLTGPVVNIRDRYTMMLKKNHYQYDYFYLNVGSTIHVKVTTPRSSSSSTIYGWRHDATATAANIYLFQGKDKLERLENVDLYMDENEDDDVFGLGALATKFISSGRGAPSSATIDHVVDTEDVYMIVYDQASSMSFKKKKNNQQGMELVVDYRVDQTSYDLSQQTPSCRLDEAAAAAGAGEAKQCSLNLSSRERRCILVESLIHYHGPATSISSSSVDSLHHDEQDSPLAVHVNVTGRRRWMLLFCCAFLPPFLCGLLCGQKCRRRRRSSSRKSNVTVTGVDDDHADANDTLTMYSIPPSASPQYTPIDSLDDVIDNIINDNNPSNNDGFLDESDRLATPLPQPIPPCAFLAQAQEVVDHDYDYVFGSSIPIVWAENVIPIPSPLFESR